MSFIFIIKSSSRYIQDTRNVYMIEIRLFERYNIFRNYTLNLEWSTFLSTVIKSLPFLAYR